MSALKWGLVLLSSPDLGTSLANAENYDQEEGPALTPASAPAPAPGNRKEEGTAKTKAAPIYI